MNRLSGAAFYFLLAALFILGGTVLEWRDEIAGRLWRDLGVARPALFFLRFDADLAFEIGERHFGGDRYDLGIAEAAYRKALAVQRDLLGPRYQLARIEFLKGDFTKALALVNEELALHPEFKRSHYVRGLIYGYRGDYEPAARDFKEFLEWDPKSWAAHNDLAWVYFASGDFVRAEEAARSGLEHNPGNSWLLLSRGTALLNLGKEKEAEQVLLRAQAAAQALTPVDWGMAYPGNAPALYPKGLEEMRNTIERNLALTREK